MPPCCTGPLARKVARIAGQLRIGARLATQAAALVGGEGGRVIGRVAKFGGLEEEAGGGQMVGRQALAKEGCAEGVALLHQRLSPDLLPAPGFFLKAAELGHPTDDPAAFTANQRRRLRA